MSFALRLVVATGLLVDAYLHVTLASRYDAVTTGSISQGDLFRLEAAAAAVSAVLVLVWRRRLSLLLAFGVAAGGVVAVLLYRYVDVGAIGPIPPMYEPVWYLEKTVSLVAEAVAAVAAAALLVLGGGGFLSRRRSETPGQSRPAARRP